MGRSIKMGSHIIWITFFLAVQFSAVLGRNHFYEYYYSKHHHKNHSTTVAMSSSTTEIASEEKMDISVSGADSLENLKHSSTGDDSLENLKHSSTADIETTVHRNRTVFSYERGSSDDFNGNVGDMQKYVMMRVGIVCGCLVLFSLGSCCIFCCIRMYCRQNQARRGFIIANPQATASEVPPQQPMQGHQPGISLPYPPRGQEERAQMFPPYYQTEQQQQQYPPVQPQPQYNPSAPLYHNPPEAPPPYEFPEKF